MEIMARDIERVPRGNLRVPLVDFARVWVAAERRADELKAAGQGDWYLVGVQTTCLWLACSTYVFNYPHGPVRHPAEAPITGTPRRAHEELIELETQAAERRLGREWPGRPGFVEGVAATLAWTWRRSGVPPIEVARAHAS
jgi:hypothetical protein